MKTLIEQLKEREQVVYWSDDPDPFYMPDFLCSQAAHAIAVLNKLLDEALDRVDESEFTARVQEIRTTTRLR